MKIENLKDYKDQEQRSFGVTIVDYILSNLSGVDSTAMEVYTHRESYWVTREWLASLLSDHEAIKRLTHSLPLTAPSICSLCKTVHEGGKLIQGGKLWRSCPYCHPFLTSTDFEWERGGQVQTELHSDIYALLSPYLTKWQVESLLCTYYGMLQAARTIGTN